MVDKFASEDSGHSICNYVGQSLSCRNIQSNFIAHCGSRGEEVSLDRAIAKKGIYKPNLHVLSTIHNLSFQS